MWEAEIVTAWGYKPSGANKAQLALAYPLLCQDITGQPSTNLQPDPNLLSVYVECEASVLDAISADGDFHILWQEEIIDDAI